MKKLFKKITILLFPVYLIVLSGCSLFKLDQLKWDGMNSDLWLKTYPWVEINLGNLNFILSKPSSSLMILLLGILTVIAGLSFFVKLKQDKSRFWFGNGLILWGIAALSAGISYQAFNYELKCAGRDLALWTNWFEVVYLFLQTLATNAMFMAVSYSSVSENRRKNMHMYALLNSLLYFLILIIGSIIPNKFMVSFEMMVLITTPTFLIMFIISLNQYRKTHDLKEKYLIMTWIYLAVVIIVYFLYMISGLTMKIWLDYGVWFSDNDVFHIGVLLWVGYIYFKLRKYLYCYS